MLGKFIYFSFALFCSTGNLLMILKFNLGQLPTKGRKKERKFKDNAEHLPRAGGEMRRAFSLCNKRKVEVFFATFLKLFDLDQM
jgi:hypothetical protein